MGGVNMNTTVRLLPYSELLQKGYKINRKGELQTESGWVIIEPQEFGYLGQQGEIVSVNTSADGGLYCGLMMLSDGVVIDYVLEDCVEFQKDGLTFNEILNQQSNGNPDLNTCNDYEDVHTLMTTQNISSEDVSKAMYQLVEIAEQGGFEITVNCSLIKEGRKISMTYQKEVE